MKKLKSETAKPLKLSAREIEVLQWVACGKSNPVIAKVLFVSENTIRFHVKNICTKLNAANKQHAVGVALTHHILVPKPPERVVAMEVLLGLSKSSSPQRVESALPLVRRSPASQTKGTVK